MLLEDAIWQFYLLIALLHKEAKITAVNVRLVSEKKRTPKNAEKKDFVITGQNIFSMGCILQEREVGVPTIKSLCASSWTDHDVNGVFSYKLCILYKFLLYKCVTLFFT